MDILADLTKTFFDECDELLGALETHLQALKAGSDDPEDVNGAFRAIHSVKGGAAAFGFPDLVSFSHVFEAALDQVRSGGIPRSEAPIDLFMRCSDALGDFVVAARSGEPAVPRPDLLGELDRLITGGDEDAALEAAAAGAQPLPDIEPEPDPEGILLVKITPKDDLFLRAVDPRRLIGSLSNLGILAIRCDLSEVPAADGFDPARCYLRFEVELPGSVAADAVIHRLEISLEENEFEVLQLDAAPAAQPVEPEPAPAAGPEAVPEDMSAALRKIALMIGDGGKPAAPAPPAAVAAAAVAEEAQRAAARASVPVPEHAAATAAPAPVAPAPVASPAASPAQGKPRAGGSVRVDLDRIDKLMNLVGEIVITQSMLVERARVMQVGEGARLADGLLTLARQTRELQDTVMAVRAQPVRTVFQRMPRLVRDLARTLGKEVRLVLHGEATEVDKTVIEELSDPLTHMIRNAMDHGLEMPDDREKAGKPREGTISLSAEQRGGRIVISIADDGRGLHREKLLAKGRANGLVTPDARLAPEEIDELIFAAGLSTVDKVTDISGRGVGMDVVRRNVEALGGRITVHSEPGHGCRFSLSLPLTLAVLDGMVVRSGRDRYVLPIASIVETMRLDPRAIEWMPGGRELLRVRNDLAHLVRLGSLVGGVDGEETTIVLIETDRAERIALAVDEIVGQQQVVVKSLEASYGRVPCASAATILGDGLVALILDVDAVPLLAAADRRPYSAMRQAG
jgi:two-component system chemotaxis sensor kinase CheA